MADFDPEEFLKVITWEKFDELRKPALIKFAKHYELEVKQTMRKQVFKNALIETLVEEDVWDESYLEKIVEVQKHGDPDAVKLKELEMLMKEKEMQMQKEKSEHEMQMQKEKLEQEFQKELAMKEMEMKQKEMEMKIQMEEKLQLEKLKLEQAKSSNTSKQTGFDAAKNIRLVPKFQEHEVDQYFVHFEKIATSLKWPKESWTLLLQSVFIGKAREIYSAMPLDKCSNYDEVKQAVLKAYELVPEAYRQRFRTSKRQDNQTHVEFARVKEQLFDRWLDSKEVGKDFGQLRQLILIEEFKKCIHSDVKTHLDESKIDILHEAATKADDYALTHKLSKPSQKPRYNQNSGSNKASQGSTQEKKTQSNSQEKGSRENSGAKSKYGSRPRSKLECDHCKKSGHLMSTCYKLHGYPPKPEGPKNESTPIGCAVPLSSEIHTSVEKQEIPQKGVETEKVREDFEPFVLEGFVSLSSDSVSPKPIKVMRDTCCGQSMILEDTLPFGHESSTGTNALIQGIGMDTISVPLHKMNLKSDLVSGTVTIGIRSELPVKGVSMLLGNDLAGTKVLPNPIVSQVPCTKDESDEEKEIFPACAVTRSMTRKVSQENSEQVMSQDTHMESSEGDFVPNLEDTFFSELEDFAGHLPSSGETKSPHVKPASEHEKVRDCDKDPLSHDKLVIEQESDPTLSKLSQRALSQQEAEQIPVCFYKQNGVLMRKWRPPDAPVDEEWKVVHQIVVPKVYHREVIGIAHDSPMAGHLGVRKTHDKIWSHFWWPTLRKDVSEYCKTCHTCQMVGKPNQKIPKAPLQTIPAFDEPFSRVLIDCVGPLPKTKSGNQYLLTIMCASTRFPEAIPLRNIKAPNIVKALIKFFTLVGLPQSIQSDQGSNFMSGLFQQVMDQLGIAQYSSSAYHPESQGALERYHQTLKTMIKSYCLEFERDWDEGIHLLLFATREAVQESLGFSPFELVFGHTVRGPLKLLKEKWLCQNPDVNLLDYVSQFRHRLKRATEIAKENLKQSQAKMKTWYDKDAKARVFKPGDKVLALFPVQRHPLQAKYSGPYEIESKVGELDYVIKTPGRRKSRQLCHVNMLKEYHERNDTVKPVCSASPTCTTEVENANDDSTSTVASHKDSTENKDNEYNVKLHNSDVLANLDKKLGHLPETQQSELKELIHEWENIFPDVPSMTPVLYHDIEVGNSEPIKQHPYRVNPIKLEHLRSEIQYMLDNDIIEPSCSEWSSPCILVPKPDGSLRFVTDFRKVNVCSKTDSYPIPRIDDCIDRIGNAKFVSKFDLLKGYWQVPLTERAKEISAFCTPEGLYQYKRMAFGLKNSAATFQRLVNRVVADIDKCEAYVDDLIVYSQTWEEHMGQLRQLFEKLSQANLTVNLVKSEFCQASVTYLGHVVGQGQIRPVTAKVEAIEKFPAPKGKKDLMRFLGMVGYYRKYCPNFSEIACPLTDLLKKSAKFVWSEQCQAAFEKIKTILMNAPVLVAPNFQKQFKLAVDASDVGCGGVLMQADENEIDHPVGFFSKKFDKCQKNYSTIEKECLALLLSLQHFDVYLCTTLYPVLVYTDHNPLTFLHKMKNRNHRLVRWSLTLQEYDLDIRHIKGKENVLADALSRAA